MDNNTNVPNEPIPPPPPDNSGYTLIQNTSASAISIIALILGILAIIPCCYHVYICAPLAIVLGFVELNKISKNQSSPKGKILAIIAIVLGFISILIFIVFFIIGASLNMISK